MNEELIGLLENIEELQRHATGMREAFDNTFRDEDKARLAAYVVACMKDWCIQIEYDMQCIQENIEALQEVLNEQK